MLNTAIRMMANDYETSFHCFRSTIDKILSGDISEQTRKDYALIKLVHQEQIKGYCLSQQKDLQEQLIYDILEMCLFFDDGIAYSSASQLANLFVIDPHVRKFAEHHVLKDGFWAKLKYTIPITTKLDVMAEALRICEST
mgnify:CR=1 FL=1